MIASLDATVPQKVAYCVPMWLRDEQIKQAVTRVKGRIQPSYEARTEPVAIVGFGPSLVDTWERVKDFKHIISCSGSHKFLVDRGIVPTFHIEVDPRPHKVALIGLPCRDTTYLISSTCHARVFDHLEGMNVLLWHVFDATADGQRLLPYGEWAITGGCDAGLRAMTIAGFLGFRDLHCFGLDGCGRETSHAAEHPNAVKKYAPVEFEGVTYQTTPALLEAARGVRHELDQMPAVKATFYGEGLIQAMMRGYQPKKPNGDNPLASLVAFTKPELISAEYRDLNQRLHRDNLAYGVGGGRHADTIIKLALTLNTRSVLDYGAGKGYLAKAIPWPIWEYDPAVPGKQESPRPADLVACTDVLEHIEPDHLNHVLADLRRCVRKVGYFVINTGPAAKTLADGRNTHLIQRDEKWWKKHLGRFFTVGKVLKVGAELHVVVGVKHQAKIAKPLPSPKMATA